MSKYKKPKVGFLDHVAGKSGQPDPIDEVLKEATENPVPKTETKKKTQKKPVIKEEKEKEVKDLMEERHTRSSTTIFHTRDKRRKLINLRTTTTYSFELPCTNL